MNKKIDNESLSLSGDYSNVALIILLYIMQGILIGVGYSLPIILHNKGNSFEDQAIFSLVFYPATGEEKYKKNIVKMSQSRKSCECQKIYYTIFPSMTLI